MISANITKQDFIIQVLERDLRRIYNTQLLVAMENIRFEGKTLEKVQGRKRIVRRSGALEDSLANPDYLIQAQGEKFIVSAKIVKHMRFLDMKKKGNWKIYNRQVWGILYNNALEDIRFKYGQQIHDCVGYMLNQALRDSVMTRAQYIEAYKKAKGRG